MKYVLLAHTFYIKSFDGCIFISFTHLKEVLFEVPFLNVGVKMFIVEAFNGAILDFSISSECQKYRAKHLFAAYLSSIQWFTYYPNVTFSNIHTLLD